MPSYKVYLNPLLGIILLLLFSCKQETSQDYSIVKSATSDKGMVVTAHPLASEAGLAILKQGGNAAGW